MPLQLPPNRYPTIHEVWGISDRAITALNSLHETFRITAERNIRSGSTARYHAAYDLLLEVPAPTPDDSGNTRFIWSINVDVPDAYGNTIQECLDAALGWVAQRANNPNLQ